MTLYFYNELFIYFTVFSMTISESPSSRCDLSCLRCVKFPLQPTLCPASGPAEIAHYCPQTTPPTREHPSMHQPVDAIRRLPSQSVLSNSHGYTSLRLLKIFISFHLFADVRADEEILVAGSWHVHCANSILTYSLTHLLYLVGLLWAECYLNFWSKRLYNATESTSASCSIDCI